MPYNKYQSDEDLTTQAHRVVQREELTVLETSEMIANKGGWHMMQMLEDLYKAVNDLKKEIDSLKQMRKQQLLVRRYELASNSKKYGIFEMARQERNAIVHGGNIEFDVEVLRWMHDNDEGSRLEDAALDGFEEMYGLHFSKCSSLISTPAKRIIDIVNKRCELRYLLQYAQSTHHKSEIESMKGNRHRNHSSRGTV
ncbi:hypothetical protein BGW36DRAFT_389997 [Talaromyces proteolyticus]|uniref:Uncharacterized protein n=1 Tax=Talaromyces proteolyticus TaxID=1131652 RepID=A0AAD4PV54_9EURO|nr:uncharacterized protein BGW36DRAFT_389997 [Talaromyces proteolyticus]KAH8689953.1 hypothetical protein BGW36DRAFT_389997 [Talaromyces proteolyticus]